MSSSRPITRLQILARAELPTRAGRFEVLSFSDERDRRLDDIAIVRPGFEATAGRVPVRMHSECLTGDALGSVRCDCRDQLEIAQRRVITGELAVLVYLRQEGRGIGIANKIRAYELQDHGLDTVEANLHLGFEDDLRRYDVAAAMLRALGVERVALHTNNPSKVDGLHESGLDAIRVPLLAAPRPENARYLTTKAAKSGHILGP